MLLNKFKKLVLICVSEGKERTTTKGFFLFFPYACLVETKSVSSKTTQDLARSPQNKNVEVLEP